LPFTFGPISTRRRMASVRDGLSSRLAQYAQAIALRARAPFEAMMAVSLSRL
jgi:hypothetical protein